MHKNPRISRYLIPVSMEAEVFPRAEQERLWCRCCICAFTYLESSMVSQSHVFTMDSKNAIAVPKVSPRAHVAPISCVVLSLSPPESGAEAT